MNHRLNVIADEATLRQTIERLAREIVHDVPAQASLLVVGILEGAKPFATELVRNLRGLGVFKGLSVELDWLKASSYHGALTSCGSVDILQKPENELQGRFVLVVDDIIDQGHTLACVCDLLKKEQPLALKVCVLLDKPSAKERQIQPDYCGLQVPQAFIVGYGLDYQENYRNLPYLASLSFDATEIEGFGLVEN